VELSKCDQESVMRKKTVQRDLAWEGDVIANFTGFASSP
jgi:hypothetical protein